MSPSDGFDVDVEALYKACLAIRRITSEMQQNPVRGIDCGAGFGHARLADVADEFSVRWQRGVKNLLLDTEVIDNRLRDTLKEYIAVDERAVRAFNQIYGGGSDESAVEE
jgi:hypothetical protein